MAEIRKCIICGKIYEYCIHCGDAKQDETWRYLYHDAKCMDIAKLWYAYKGNEISRKDAVNLMSRDSDRMATILANDSIPAKAIKEMYDAEKRIDVIEEPIVEIEIDENVGMQSENSDEVVAEDDQQKKKTRSSRKK